MKIGILTDDYLPAQGGAEMYAYFLAEFLRAQGHEVAVFTFSTTNEATERGGLRVVRSPWSWRPKALFAFWKRLLAFAREHDALHAIDSYKIGFYASVASILAKKPLYTSLEGRGILDLPGERFKYRLAHDMYRWVTLHRSSGTIAVCKEFERIAKRIAPKNPVAYLPNPVDADFFKPGPTTEELAKVYEGKLVILTVRRLVPKNGIQYLIQALPGIRTRFPNAQYVAIGGGRYEKEIRALAERLGVADMIDFLGTVPNERIKPYIARADVVAFPSSAEATSLACTEVMAMGKPVVASAIGGYPEMIADGVEGFLVRLFDREDSDYAAPPELPAEKIKLLENAVCALLEDAELRARMGIAARQRVERDFAWSVVGPKIVKLYQA